MIAYEEDCEGFSWLHGGAKDGLGLSMIEDEEDSEGGAKPCGLVAPYL